jgi:RNA polymerase sigma factor (sigma-70 family)
MRRISIMNARGPALVIRQVRDWLAGHPGGARDDSLLRRFAAGHDDAAFAELVHRHGGMVVGVCQRVLGDAHDAEDAFQATFLVLVRKAATIRRAASLSCWLHGVAQRVALEARRGAARRRARERQAATSEASAAPMDATAAEFRAILDEELQRLPEKYRAPLVLHYLEGRTKEETAGALGWTEGTVSGRLARARDLLRSRLTRRGVVVSLVALSAALAQEAALASVSAALTAATVRLVGLYLAGESAVGANSVSVIRLTERVVRNLFLARLKIAAAVLLVSAAALGMAGFLYQAHADSPLDKQEPPLAAALQADRKAADTATQRKPDQPLLRVPLPPRTMMTVTLSADGKRLAVAPHDETTVALWDVATRKGHTLEGNPFSVTAMAFSPDGKTLATGTGSWLPDSAPGETKLWDVASGKKNAPPSAGFPR